MPKFYNKSEKVKEIPNPKPTPKICIIGGGLSGLTIAIQLKRKLGLDSFTIYEKNSDFGGTWLVNVYPGCKCDIPARFYSWSFEPKDWSSIYATQSQMLEYIRSIAQKYDLYSHTNFNTEIKSLTWIESKNQWKVECMKKGELSVEIFDFVIVGISRLSFPKIPEEFNNFKGPKFHSAQWDSSIDLTNKTVGIVGSGPSAVQIIPELVPIVSKLHCYQRNPIWLLPKPLDNTNFPVLDRKILKAFPWLHKPHRWIVISSIELYNRAVRKEGSLANRIVKQICKSRLKAATQKRPEIRKILKPSLNVLGCHTPGIIANYYESLCSSNVEIHREEIKSVMEHSIILENGEEHKIDVLILATGFKYNTFLDSVEIKSESGQDISNCLNEGQLNYYQGLCAEGVKNLLFANGPYIPIHSALFAMEMRARNFIMLLAHMKKFNYKTFCIKSEVASRDREKFMTVSCKMGWSRKECHPYLKEFLYPYSGYHLWKKLRKFESTMYDFE